MDREQLENELKPFFDKLNGWGRPIQNYCLRPAFEGDDTSSYILEVTGDWIDPHFHGNALDILLDSLWGTTSESTRRKVFSIMILNNEKELYCFGEQKQSEAKVKRRVTPV